MTQEINLPPLPDVTPGKYGFHASDMHDYARAAIALDRQGRGEPVAFSYDLATTRSGDGEYIHWSPRLSYSMPNVPDGGIRNLQWLYASLQPAEPVSMRLLIQAKEFLEGLYDEGPDSAGWKSDALNVLIAEIEAAIKTSQPAEPVRQYYYQVSGCEADSTTHPNCICWHDKGTGPYKDMAEGDRPYNAKFTWRDKPQTTSSVAPTLHNADSVAQNGNQAPQPVEPVKVPSDEVQRDTIGETWMGMRVAAWQWKEQTPLGEATRHTTHWSTGPKDAERLYRENDIRALLARYGQPAQPECGCCGKIGGCDPDCDAAQPAASAEPLCWTVLGTTYPRNWTHFGQDGAMAESG
ncbi:hypothetical protein CHELA1G11_10878 [Hyphomicrobiales bacterium]|nr:hypothetical protein CHELA1G11_10878 [Hyphomicrobiales bacterium]CAH1671685.1 hypothetical protein CHELA1G2_13431 [Hyphomicrobiales bacterium]